MLVRIMLVATLAMLAAAPADARDIHKRKARQEHRIEKGEASGRISPTEAARLRNQEGAINREEQAMREANGGKLTAGERRVITRQQNRASRHIHRQAHDANGK